MKAQPVTIRGHKAQPGWEAGERADEQSIMTNDLQAGSCGSFPESESETQSQRHNTLPGLHSGHSPQRGDYVPASFPLCGPGTVWKSFSGFVVINITTFFSTGLLFLRQLPLLAFGWTRLLAFGSSFPGKETRHGGSLYVSFLPR